MAAPCCTNTVTPKMIRKGEVKIGDRIHLDEVLVSAPEETVDFAPNTQEVSAEVPDAVPVHSTMQQTMQPPQAPQAWPQMTQQQMSQMPQMQMRTVTPLTYGQMTPYMNQTQISQRGNETMFTVPQTPMTTQEFQETIDSTDVQSYLGFMRTQIGRYMRLEQLMGSNNIEQRFGFLVGLGSNYVILQEITSGNIMVVDLFTIRLTYIYYSDPVVPPGVPF